MLEQIKQVVNNMPNKIEILNMKMLSKDPIKLQDVDNPKRTPPASMCQLTKTADTNTNDDDIVLVIAYNMSQRFVVIDKVV